MVTNKEIIMGQRIARLTKRIIDAALPGACRYILWDTELKGFGVRVEVSGTKTFLIRYRANGRKRFVAVGRYGTLTPDEARQAARNMLVGVAKGHDPANHRAEGRTASTVGHLVELFLADHVEAKRKGSTATHYRGLLENYLLPKFAAWKARDIKRPDLARLHLSMQGRPYQANRLLAVVASMYSFGEKYGLTPEGFNPTAGIDRFPEASRQRFLTREEMSCLGEALNRAETTGLPWEINEEKPTAKYAPKEDKRRTLLDPFAVAAIRLLILTGGRLREILDARWEHVDFERGIMHLPDSKTGAKPLYLSDAAQAILTALPRVEGNPYVIPGEKNGAPRADLKKPWKAIRKAAGLEGVRIHDLRHSFASVAAGASLGLPIIGKLLGHTQASTTHRYAHLDADPLHRASELIGATISAALSGGLRSEGRVATGLPRAAKSE
jgi:integrase